MQEKQGVKADYLAVLFGVSVEVVHSLARHGVVLKKPGPNCFALLAESVRAYCTHLPGMAAGRGTAPSQWRNPSCGLGWNKLQADAVELRSGVERWSTWRVLQLRGRVLRTV